VERTPDTMTYMTWACQGEGKGWTGSVGHPIALKVHNCTRGKSRAMFAGFSVVLDESGVIGSQR